MKLSPACALVVAAACVAPSQADDWRSLFKGDLTGWKTWLGRPHESVTVPGLKRDAETGKYTEPIGWGRDPLGVFTVETVDGRPAIHISGQILGLLITDEPFADYHLRLQFKWGERRFAPRLETVRDSGLLYHAHGEPGASSGVWPASVELQIQEHDCGDLWAILTQAHVRARPATIEGHLLHVYDPSAEPVAIEQKPGASNRCIKLADHEKPTGEWNTIELVTLGDRSVHVVNGEVVMRLGDLRRREGDAWKPLTAGRIVLQSELAEVYFRDLSIRPIKEIPPQFAVP